MSVGSRSIYRASSMVNPADEIDEMELLHQQALEQQQHQRGLNQIQTQSFYDSSMSTSNRPVSNTPGLCQFLCLSQKNSDLQQLLSTEQISRMLAQQEAEFGINMLDSLVPTDEAEIERLMAAGYTHEDAVLAIFQQRYQSNVNKLSAIQLFVRNLQ
jgi:hypothetical protein